MDYIKLGHTSIEVSRIAFGSMSIVENPTYSGVEEQQAIDAIHAAMDVGITLFDTAPGYGNGAAEIVLGRALTGGRRERVIIADKIHTPTLSPEDVRNESTKALERLGTDYIDLYQIHWPKNIVPIEETLRAMEDLVTSGKVRALGVCNFGPEDLRDALDVSPLVTNQIAYSLFARATEFELTDLLLEHDMGILCYSPVAQGLLAGKYSSADEVPDERARTRLFSCDRPQARHQDPGCEDEAFQAIAEIRALSQELGIRMSDLAIGWLLAQPAVASVLVGASTPEQVRQNAVACDLALDRKVIDQLSAITDPVKQALGANLDPWQSESRIR